MVRNWGKIQVSVRLEKMVEADFFRSWSVFLTQGLRKGDSWSLSQGLTAQNAANELVRKFLKSEADSIFFLDSDAVIDVNFLDDMRDSLEGQEYDVLQAFYVRRGWPPQAIWFKRDVYQKLHVCIVPNEMCEEVALVGLHCTLIRREVFEKMAQGKDLETFAWFWYPRETGETEDAAFSFEAIQAGFKLGATTVVKAEHISHLPVGWEAYQDYLATSGQVAQMEVYDQLVKSLSTYLKESPELVMAKMAQGSMNVREGWKKYEPESPQEVREFYGKDDSGYFYDLAAWNSSSGYIQIVSPLRTSLNKRCLVIGPGLGSEIDALLLGRNQVDAFELPGALRTFLDWRYQKESLVTFLKGETLAEALRNREKKEPYQMVVAIDVFEHIHPSEIDEFNRLILESLIPGGILYAHMNFTEGDLELYPMHYLSTQGTVKTWLSDYFNVFAEDLMWKKKA